jgi:hypothetical protein
LSFVHHLHDLGEQSVCADFLCAHDKRPSLIDCRSDYLVMSNLLDGNWLSRHHRLINAASSFYNNAIDRNLLAWSYAQ